MPPRQSNIESQNTYPSAGKDYHSKSTMSVGKTLRKKITKHDCFLSYAIAELTPYWKQIFENCAMGVFPKGISYKDGIVYAKKGKKKPTRFVLPVQPREAADEFKRFLHKELGEISIDELTKKRSNLDVALRQNIAPKDTTWAQIRAPTVKTQLIALYVSDMKSELDLSEEEAQNLKTVLNAGLAAKQITADDITMENNRIVNIANIDVDDRGFFLTTAGEVPEIYMKVSKTTHGQSSCMGGWDKKVEAFCDFMSISAN